MNIIEAKTEIKNSIEMYLQKNQYGDYIIDVARQRPCFLLGAPGIGKTAIMSQIADEMDLPLVSYTITHHTRQSAIGLPMISKKTYNNVEVSVTEYTLSEIIATVYEEMARSGKEEGILFIDEINCVSETLAPAILDLLQNKKFGPHKIPKGWILVTAGNPVEFNKSVKEFDIVTLDRVKKIVAEPDFNVWKKYAYGKLFHEAVIGFLKLKPHYVFAMEKSIDGYYFATPRGWEDLAIAINSYENLGFEVNSNLIEEYIQHHSVAMEFYRYYGLFVKYKRDYDVNSIMAGDFAAKVEKLKSARFDERFAIAEVFTSAIGSQSRDIMIEEAVKNYFVILTKRMKNADYEEKIAREKKVLLKKLESGYLTKEDKVKWKKVLEHIESADFDMAKLIVELSSTLETKAKEINNNLDNLFDFTIQCFGEGQELIAFMINLMSSTHFVSFVTKYRNDRFYKYNEMLIVKNSSAELQMEAQTFLDN